MDKVLMDGQAGQALQQSRGPAKGPTLHPCDQHSGHC